MTKPFIVGITGGSASGKTLFLEHLLRSFSSEELCMISQDNYYKPRHLQPVDALLEEDHRRRKSEDDQYWK